ncbi:hypothetical protein PMIN06_004340 [Paraphaeosphaeria minitans]|uniref:Arid/bright DNA binding domain-containing protein n=1 Tax=Paraphaeosphaeria minitans TaxID=565426 RepID=A0A9P6G9Y2_9PLEO|nr:arid/bright DNA binding domain-containing protein [Paraphaeosphaeria minitans]
MDFQSSQNAMYDPSNFIDPSAMSGNQINGTRPYPMSSIPQKRDSTGATMSRSQTPSQFQQGGFQQGFAHTPSPTMQNQHFRPGQMPPQRMQTASPAQNPHAPQMSPMNFAQGSPMGQGFDPNAGGQFPVQSVQSIQLSQNLQHKQQEAQRAYAMRLQAQQQQLGNLAASNMAAQQRHQAGQTPGAPPRQPGMPPQMMSGQMQQNPQANPQTFLKNVHSLMAQNRRPFNPQPQVAGRPIDLFNLYSIVIKFRGSRNVTTNNAWPRITQHIGVPVQQFPNAPEELRQIYEANLGLYEQMYIRSKTQQQNTMGQMGQTGQTGQMGQMGQQMSPTRNPIPGASNSAAAAAQQEYLQQLQRKQMQQQAQRQSDVGLQQQPQQFEQPVERPQSTPLQSNATPALANGQSTPQADGNLAAQHRKSLSRPLEATPVPSSDPAQPSGTPIKTEIDVAAAQSALEQKRHIEEEEDGIYYRPATNLTIKNTWGVLELSDELVQEVSKKLHWMPNVPELREMGVVDIRALTMSLRSGLHAETRLALDTLSKLTHENNIQLDLEQCDDLVDVLAEYAEDQLEILGTDNPEVTDIIELMSYEDILHNCQAEVNALQDLPEFGTKAYDLDRTADQVLAITSIIRNLSFLEINHARLSSPPVLKFLSNAIRLVGTRMLFLRSYIHTLDFMKDLITFFSNASTRIALPSREDAYAVLHFLCAFAPSPRPTLPIRFTLYNPKIHRYLPSAVDSMAKLLAIDDPNRTYYKQIFVNEATSDPPYDLLTRAFALAIAVVPDRTEGKLHDLAETRPKEVGHYEARIAETRKPYLMQGMLAADILASLAPGPESGVCRSWLEAEDGWANSLLKFAMSLCSLDARMQQPPPQPNHRGQRPMEQDREGYHLIVNRALSMIKRLGDKSKGAEPLVKCVETDGTSAADDDDDDDWLDDMEEFDVGSTTWKVKADILPRKETVLGALLMHQLDARALRQFCGLGYLAEN